jgi:hypothetical protein
MAKTKFDMLVAHQQANSTIAAALSATTSQQLMTTDELVNESSPSLKAIHQQQQSIEEDIRTNASHEFTRHPSFPAPLSPLLSLSSLSSGDSPNMTPQTKNKNSTSPTADLADCANNNSKQAPGGNSTGSMVKRVSHSIGSSIEKGVSKILHHQEWNILHERRSAAASPEVQPSNTSNAHSVSSEKLSASEHTITPLVLTSKQSPHRVTSVEELDEEEQLLRQNTTEDCVDVDGECETTREPMLVSKNNHQDVEASSNAATGAVTVEETSLSVSGSNKTRNSEPHFFIEEAIRELLRSRRILRCSYVYGYYLDTFGHKKFIFELIQTEFEGM